MAKREKRLKKGILSIERQRKLHEIKRKYAEKLGQEELVRYYIKEIKSLENRRKNRENKLKKLTKKKEFLSET